MELIGSLLAFFILVAASPSSACEAKPYSHPALDLAVYSPNKETHHRNNLPQALILPPTGGMNAADKSLAKSLCKRGIQTLILNYPQKSGFTTNLKIHDQLTTETLALVETTLEHFPQPTVIVGASLGGLYAQIALGQALSGYNPNLQAIKGSVITVAGGSLAEVLASSKLDSVVEQKYLRMDHYGLLSSEDYVRLLTPQIKYDPLLWAQASQAPLTLFFGSEEDTTVPTSAQRQLWEKLGRPQSRWLRSSHATTIARVYFLHKNEIAEHILKTLKP